MRRLEHLSGIERMSVGVVVVKAGGCFIKNGGCFGAEWCAGSVGEVGEALIELMLSATE